MKGIILLVMVFSVGAFAAPKSLESCLSQADQLDREYCQKKRIRSINKKYDQDFAKYQKGYSQIRK